MNDKKLMNLAADNIRILAASMVEKANSGHPGGAMGGADFVNVLFSEFLVYDPENPAWEGRDRFFLDPGHMSPMLYSTLALAGKFTLDELKEFRQWGRECRHNVGYWTRQDYLGFGLGAASLYGNLRFANTADWNRYLENSSDPEQIREKEPVLTTEDEMAEFMFLGLRMTRGIARTDFARTFGCPVEKIYGEVLDRYMAMGMLQEKEDRIFLTRPGIHVSNQIMAEFLL